MTNEQKTSDTAETHGTANETDKQKSNSKELIEKIEIEKTPFTAIRQDDKWFLTMGRYRLTQPLDSKEEALAAGVDESWWRIMQIIKIMITEHENEKGKEVNGTKITGEIETRKLK